MSSGGWPKTLRQCESTRSATSRGSICCISCATASLPTRSLETDASGCTMTGITNCENSAARSLAQSGFTLVAAASSTSCTK